MGFVQVADPGYDGIWNPRIVMRGPDASAILIDGNPYRRLALRSGSRLMLLVFFAHFAAVLGMLAYMYLACALLLNGITSTPS